MKPQPAKPSDLRTPETPKSNGPNRDNNAVGIIVTAVTLTALVIIPVWAMHAHYLNNQITTIRKQLDETRNIPGKNNSDS